MTMPDQPESKPPSSRNLPPNLPPPPENYNQHSFANRIARAADAAAEARAAAEAKASEPAFRLPRLTARGWAWIVAGLLGLVILWFLVLRPYVVKPFMEGWNEGAPSVELLVTTPQPPIMV
jgi:hypothetical protein